MASARIVVRHVSAPQLDLVATLEDEAGATRPGRCGCFATAEPMEKVRRFSGSANELDRLEAEQRRG